MDGERLLRYLIGVGVLACIGLFAVGLASPLIPPGMFPFGQQEAGVASSSGNATPEPLPAFRRRMRDFCRDRLASYKTPARVEIVDSEQYSARFKKMRRAQHL